MTDEKIIALYFARNEQAIYETDRSYGAFCRRIATNILRAAEDAEECVNDTYLNTWNAIPPEHPSSLKAFLARLTRNLAISRYRKAHAKKRGADAILAELDDCIPARETLWQTIESKRLAEVISDWLRTLDSDDSALFVRRYFSGDDVKTLASLCGVTQTSMAGRLFRLRQKLKKRLKEENFDL